ncbi:MAG: hypothetical protein ABIK65_11345 [Candidatus Eisenbacteria bacterium]
MKNLKPGDRVRARVLGFLPGRKALLDLEGRTVVAWTDLPLAIGRVVTAVLEDSGEGPMLRVRDGEGGGKKSGGAGSGPSTETLESLIASTAAEFGLRREEAPPREVIRALRETIPALEKEPVPLLRLRDEIATLLAARVRGLPSSRRALAALRSGGGARMGRALGRLVDELAGLEHLLRGASCREAARRARRLDSYFLDLTGAGEGEALLRALCRCGYGYEARLAASGRDGWGEEDPGAGDLKGELIDLDRWLRTLSSRDLPRRSGPARRGVFRASAWAGRTLDTIESIQVNNLGGTGGAGETAWQVPVSISGERGTLFLLLRTGESRVWLDLGGREVLSLRVGAEGGPLTVHLPTGGNRAGRAVDGARIARALRDDPGVVAVRVGGEGGSVPRVDFVL